MSAVIRENLFTLGKHLAGRVREGALEAELVTVLEAIALAGRSIAHKVRRARIDDILGDVGETNVQGEEQQKLDVLSDDLLLHCLRDCPAVGFFASEEQDESVPIRSEAEGGRYGVLVDPLDGSSNIDVAAGVGTIFSILPAAAGPLQPGRNQLAAGYILYGSSVLLVLTTGSGVDMYVLDPVVGDFLLVQTGLALPSEKKIYSLNEAYVNDFSDGVRAYLEWAHAAGYGARYIGSMVADVHRTLLKGGVFLYPATAKAPSGKLRLLYEANPMSFVIEQAGGRATDGVAAILDQKPGELHQRTVVILGSATEVDQVTSRL